MAVYTFKHGFVGKSKQAPGTAGAHVRYASRKSATYSTYAERMPRNAHAAERFVQEREQAIRKNGRVLDKFIIALPREATHEQAEGMLIRLGHRITRGKAPFRFTIQDWNSQNPHAHFQLIDDVYHHEYVKTDSGRRKRVEVWHSERVFKTTSKGSTVRLRALWQDVCNAELERHGYDVRIDRRPQREVEADAVNHFGYKETEFFTVNGVRPGIPEMKMANDNKNAILPPAIDELAPDAPIEALPSEPVDAMVPASDQEQDMDHDEALRQIREGVEASLAEDAEPDGPGRIKAGREPETVAEKVKGAHQLGKRVKELRVQRERLTLAQDTRDTADARALAARMAERQEEQAREELRFHERAWGLAGFKLFGWKSPGRRAAEKAKGDWHDAAADRRRADELAQQAESVAAEHEAYTQEVSRQIEGYRDMSPTQRREALRDMAHAEEQIGDDRLFMLQGVKAEEIFASYRMGEITAEEALEACEVFGYDGCAETIRIYEEREIEQAEGMGM